MVEDSLYLCKITVKEYANEKIKDGIYSIEAMAVEKIGIEGIHAGITSIEGHALDPDAISAMSNMLLATSTVSNFSPNVK